MKTVAYVIFCLEIIHTNRGQYYFLYYLLIYMLDST